MSDASSDEVRFEGAFCTLTVTPRPGALLVTIEGHDSGEFGQAPMATLERLLTDRRPLQLFIDARAAKGASIAVSNDWALWLGANRERFSRIHMLTGSKLVEITANFARNFSGLEQTMRIYTDPASFEGALEQANGV